MGVSEELPKQDALFGAVTSRIIETLRSLLNNDEKALNEHLLVNGHSVEDYLMSFHWNNGRYRTDRPLPELLEALAKEMQSIDNVMKQKLNNYGTAKGQLQQLERARNGNLSVRSLADVVQRGDIVDPGSDFLTTLLVAVPKCVAVCCVTDRRNQTQDWLAKYERLTQFVVPRSSNKLAEDAEYALFSVALFKKVRDEFVQKARENKFIVRDFHWDEGLLERERAELHEAGQSEKELWTELLRLSRTNFSEAYQALTHFKVIRTFVESVLRFGLPAEYAATVIRPDAKRAKSLLKSLTTFYTHLNEYLSRRDNLQRQNDTSAHHDTPGEYANLLEQEVYPFVLTEQLMITA